jgi:hypothetical protein
VSFETERYTSSRIDKIKALEYEINVLRMALTQHGQLIERLKEAEDVIQLQVTDSAFEYKKKYALNGLDFESCGKCLNICKCED